MSYSESFSQTAVYSKPNQPDASEMPVKMKENQGVRFQSKWNNTGTCTWIHNNTTLQSVLCWTWIKANEMGLLCSNSKLATTFLSKSVKN